MVRFKGLEELEDELAVAKGNLANLTHFRSIVLAEQSLKATKEGAKSVAASEAIARNSEEYRSVVVALAAATEEEARLWFRYRRMSREFGL